MNLARPTITDVSVRAGVSIKTVSRVINHERYVGAATRARVEAAIAELGFAPSLAARSLAGRRSFQVALICDNPNPYFVYEMQSGVRARCVEEGVRMIAQPYDRSAAGLIEEITSLVDELKPDGLILTPPVSDRADVLALLDARGVRYVRITPGTADDAVGEAAGVDAVASIGIDHHAAAYDMTCHLLGLGHRRIGFLSGDPGYATSAMRRAGYERALGAAGIAVDASLISGGAFSFAAGMQAGAALLLRPDRPTAIFASSDDLAAGALAAAHHAGVRVPSDVSIAGFDDSAIAQMVWPPLTTVRQPMRTIAYAAADMLFDPDCREARTIAHDLIVRASTAQAPAAIRRDGHD